MSEADRADLHAGLELFNAGEYWESHEAWERIWQRHTEPWRFFIQGLIQAAAAHHQLRRGIQYGAIKHLKNALAKLEVAPPDFAGLALEEFRAHLRKLVMQIENLKPREFTASKNLEVASLRWSASPAPL
ncbi:DUF309 domain-containing protein [candidate division KSB1 bacterium]|nr:DUF309 domain-containing protein [candidate division KSB1 bacterium]